MDVSVSESRINLDSLADQCAVGRNALLVHDYERPINVMGYDPTGPVFSNLHTVSAALAYDDATTGQTVILIVNRAIYICPMREVISICVRKMTVVVRVMKVGYKN